VTVFAIYGVEPFLPHTSYMGGTVTSVTSTRQTPSPRRPGVLQPNLFYHGDFRRERLPRRGSRGRPAPQPRPGIFSLTEAQSADRHDGRVYPRRACHRARRAHDGRRTPDGGHPRADQGRRSARNRVARQIARLKQRRRFAVKIGNQEQARHGRG
jgi:hypothetical protein